MQNINDMVKESMVSNVIKCEYTENFETILNKLKKTQLKSIVDAHGLKGCSALAKGGLIERIKETISDANRLEYILCGFDELMMSDFVMLANEAYVTQDATLSGCVLVLYRLGYVLPVMKDKEVVYVMPEVVKEAYKAIDLTTLEATKARADLIYLYMKALVNLYGVCEFNQLVTVFNQYEEGELTPEEALNVLFCKLTFKGDVQSFGPLFVSDALLMDSEMEAVKLYDLHQDKPYYMPTKEEVLKFGTDQGDWTEELEKVEAFIFEHIVHNDQEAHEITDAIGVSFAYEYQPKYAFMLLEDRGVEIGAYGTSQQLMVLLTDAYNHARTWENKGFRQVDLKDSQQSESAPMIVPMINPVKSTKVGRNEPCPCESGKKYKKCCGR